VITILHGFDVNIVLDFLYFYGLDIKILTALSVAFPSISQLDSKDVYLAKYITSLI